MKDYNENEKYIVDEVDLKALFREIWKRKLMIIIITLVFSMLAAIFSIFVISPVYNTKLNIIISMPEKFPTRYGEYQLPLTTNEQYIQLFTSNDVLLKTIHELKLNDEINVDNLRKNITIINRSSNAQTSNSFEITVSANTAIDSLNLAQSLYNNYINFLDIMLKEQIVNYFYNNFTVESVTLESKLDQEQRLLKANEDLLTQTKMELNVKKAGIEISEQLGIDSNYVIPVDTINPNFIKLETDIISNKQTINSLINIIDMNNKYIKELGAEKVAIEKYYETGKSSILNIDLISIVESSVYIPSHPVAPSSKASPSLALNIGISTVLGGMISIMIALFQWYWNKEK